jgi:hypothetical protein
VRSRVKPILVVSADGRVGVGAVLSTITVIGIVHLFGKIVDMMMMMMISIAVTRALAPIRRTWDGLVVGMEDGQTNRKHCI